MPDPPRTTDQARTAIWLTTALPGLMLMLIVICFGARELSPSFCLPAYVRLLVLLSTTDNQQLLLLLPSSSLPLPLLLSSNIINLIITTILIINHHLTFPAESTPPAVLHLLGEPGSVSLSACGHQAAALPPHLSSPPSPSPSPSPTIENPLPSISVHPHVTARPCVAVCVRVCVCVSLTSALSSLLLSPFHSSRRAPFPHPQTNRHRPAPPTIGLAVNLVC